MKIYALLEYINKNGNVSIKSFSDESSAREFVARLEKRNVEYILTVL